MNDRERITRRAAKELQDGYVVNLGIGMPTIVADYAPKDISFTLQSENGILGMGSAFNADSAPCDIVNAGGKAVSVLPGACFFDSATSFSIIRGGHVDLTILGALQVDETGSLASHIIPGKMVPGMGGAMDLVTGSRKVVVTMTHTAKDGSPKILKRLNLPATADSRVNLIITELAVIEVTDSGLTLLEVAENTSVEEVLAKTEAPLTVNDTVSYF